MSKDSGFENIVNRIAVFFTSVAEPHHFNAALASGKNFDAATAPTLLYSKAKLLKRSKV
jgi:hypothetical protein